MKALWIFLSAAVLSGCASHAHGPIAAVDIYEDRGGYVSRYYTFVALAQRLKLPVAIRGICSSACALKLAAGENLCVDRTATIEVHEVRTGRDNQSYAESKRDEEATEEFRKFLPPCAEKLFSERKGFASGTLVFASGAEILKACPEIKPCP